MPQSPWPPVPTGRLAVSSLAFGGLLLWLRSSEDGFIGLDYVNLAFHEAGHLIFGVLGPTLGLYGGTLGQLVFPIVVAVAFYRQRDPVGVAVGSVWAFENLLNIARYVADARTQVLPLVGGGEHDWTSILGRWGALGSDTTIAAFVSAVGWSGMLGSWGWLLWRSVAQRRDRFGDGLDRGPAA